MSSEIFIYQIIAGQNHPHQPLCFTLLRFLWILIFLCFHVEGVLPQTGITQVCRKIGNKTQMLPFPENKREIALSLKILKKSFQVSKLSAIVQTPANRAIAANTMKKICMIVSKSNIVMVLMIY